MAQVFGGSYPAHGRVWTPTLGFMIIVTTNDVPGHQIDATMGECFGLTVRSRNFGSNIGASFKALAGGELKGITELLIQCRQEALSRLAGEAQSRGANAVVAFRFETTEYAQTGIEVCAYGTAVHVTPTGQQQTPTGQGFEQVREQQQFAGGSPSHGQPQGEQQSMGQQFGMAQPRQDDEQGWGSAQQWQPGQGAQGDTQR